MKRIVEKLGHETVTAEDGAPASRLRKHAARPDPDGRVMPNLNGFQGNPRDLEGSHHRADPVVLVTTKDQETDKVWGMRQGAKGLYHQALHREPSWSRSSTRCSSPAETRR
jgi:twitching motility two-component system response regulator PilH